VSCHKKHPLAYALTLVLMPVYFFIVVLHLFVVPSFRENDTTAGKAAYKTNTQLAYYLVRNDRSTFSESKSAKTFQKKRTHQRVALISNISPLLNAVKYNSFISQFPPDHHHLWLANRILRI
jgi:hypothetical protein